MQNKFKSKNIRRKIKRKRVINEPKEELEEHDDALDALDALDNEISNNLNPNNKPVTSIEKKEINSTPKITNKLQTNSKNNNTNNVTKGKTRKRKLKRKRKPKKDNTNTNQPIPS